MTRWLPMLLLAGGSASLTASCASAPDARLMSLKVHGVKTGASTSPDPYGYQFIGSADAALVRGTPVELWGPSGTARFQGLLRSTRVADGVFHFIAHLTEKDYFKARSFLEMDPNVRIVFVDDEGRRIVAAGRIE